MKLYVVVEDIDDWAENGGGVYPIAIFLNAENAQKYVEKRMENRHNNKYSYFIETWNTADEIK